MKHKSQIKVTVGNEARAQPHGVTAAGKGHASDEGSGTEADVHGVHAGGAGGDGGRSGESVERRGRGTGRKEVKERGRSKRRKRRVARRKGGKVGGGDLDLGTFVYNDEAEEEKMKKRVEELNALHRSYRKPSKEGTVDVHVR